MTNTDNITTSFKKIKEFNKKLEQLNALQQEFDDKSKEISIIKERILSSTVREFIEQNFFDDTLNDTTPLKLSTKPKSKISDIKFEQFRLKASKDLESGEWEYFYLESNDKIQKNKKERARSRVLPIYDPAIMKIIRDNMENTNFFEAEDRSDRVYRISKDAIFKGYLEKRPGKDSYDVKFTDNDKQDFLHYFSNSRPSRISLSKNIKIPEKYRLKSKYSEQELGEMGEFTIFSHYGWTHLNSLGNDAGLVHDGIIKGKTVIDTKTVDTKTIGPETNKSRAAIDSDKVKAGNLADIIIWYKYNPENQMLNLIFAGSKNDVIKMSKNKKPVKKLFLLDPFINNDMFQIV